MKKCKKANKWITDGKVNKRIYDEDPIPEGWRLGITHAENYIPIWITDGITDRRINEGDPIPDGWRHGISQARNNGMVWIHKKEFRREREIAFRSRKVIQYPTAGN